MLYALTDDTLFERSALQQICFKAPALLLVSAPLSRETVLPWQVRRPARSRAKKAKLDSEGNVVGAARFFGVELCLKERPSLMYAERGHELRNVKAVGSSKKKPSSLMISVCKKRKNSATSSGDGEK